MFKIKQSNIHKFINEIDSSIQYIECFRISKIQSNDTGFYTIWGDYQGEEITIVTYYQGFLKKGLYINIHGYFNQVKFEFKKYEFIAQKIDINIEKSFSNMFKLNKSLESVYNDFCSKNLSVKDIEETIENSKSEKQKELLTEFLNIFKEQNTYDKLMLLNLDDHLINQIYFTYKDNAYDVIETNPYILIKHFNKNISYCDNIAKKLGIYNIYDNRRIVGILYEIFRESKKDGDSYLKKEIIIKKLTEKFYDDNANINIYLSELDFLNQKGDFVKIEDKYFLKEIFDMENNLSKNIAQRVKKDIRDIYSNIEETSIKMIKEFELKHGFPLHNNQITAINNSFKYPFHIITGGPGTGKSTIQGVIYSILKEYYKEEDIGVFAPTGIAGKNISKKIESKAQTLHSGLGYNPYSFKNQFEYNEKNKLPYKVIIIDETSMVSTFMFLNFLKALKRNTHIILVGDPDQLFSIDFGQVLSAMIESNNIPVTELSEGFRFNGSVLLNAYKIKNGETDLIYDKDFLFADIKDSNEELKLIEMLNAKEQGHKISRLTIDNQKFIVDKKNETIYENLLKRAYSHYLTEYNKEGIKALTPFNKGFFGVTNNNRIISQLLFSNKDKIEKYGKKFVIGDVVINTLNNKNLNIMNGDNGVIKDIYEEGEGKRKKMVFEIDFNGDIVYVKGADIKHIEHSYSMTIHKSQGSGFPLIIIPVFENNIDLFDRKLLYTAITRSQAKVVMIGKRELLKKIIENNYKRNTYLNILINNLFKNA